MALASILDGAGNFFDAIRSFFDSQACTLAESWNFGALIVVGALISIALLLLRERSRQRRENNYFW